MSFICESGIGHVVGYIAEVGFNICTNYNYPALSNILHEFIIEPIIDYTICHELPDLQQIIEIINNYSSQDILRYDAHIIYQNSTELEKTHIHTNPYFHPYAPQYGTDIFYQNSTVINYSLQDTALYLAEFYVKYQASVVVNAVIAWHLGVIEVPIISAFIFVMPSVIMTNELISLGFSDIPSIIDEISLFDNNTLHLHTDAYVHPCALRYGTDIFYQNFTEVENETCILLQEND